MPVSHIPIVYLYRRLYDSDNFFEVGLLKEALSKVLVPFYPLAGRLGIDNNGRTEIQCNGEGVLFVEAETSYFLDDLGDFESSLNLMQLVPADLDHTKDVSFYPLVMIQVTHFKCGGVCLGGTFLHTLVDATSKYHFINSWSEITRGVPISIPPSFNRATLNVGVPTSPTFHHIEYDPPPSMNIPKKLGSISTAILKLSKDQMNNLKEKSKKNHEPAIKYSRFEILAAHIWRCTCKARGLSIDQVSKLDIPTNGQFRLNPTISPGYVGNLCFSATPIALSGDIQSEPLNYTVERIHKALKQMDDKYLKSALAYLKQQPVVTDLSRGAEIMNCPNLMISNLTNMPAYSANFGWGRPVYTRPVFGVSDGEVLILPSPTNDGSWLVVIDLETNHLQLFKRLFYDIFLARLNVRSRY